MEYIILDLEWDSVYLKSEKRFINQILQIGAVRLNEEKQVIDTFTRTICSAVSRKVTGRFAKLTGITSEMMREGIPFEQAVTDYNAFALGAEVTMTWSNSDLYTIMENEEHLLKNGVTFKIQGYLDLQKLVQAELRKIGYESKNQISLEGAAELLGINTEGYSLHTALEDCRVCAIMFGMCGDKKGFEGLVRDATAPEFYARLKFKPYPISDINDESIKPAQLEFCCPECGEKAKRLGAFKYRNRWFTADFKCLACGYKFNGRVAFKKTFDDTQIKRKVCEYKPKKRKNNDMQPLPEKVQSNPN